MLVTEFNQLQNDPSTAPATTSATVGTTSTKNEFRSHQSKFKHSSETKISSTQNQQSTDATNSPLTTLSSPLYENVINSLERRQRERRELAAKDQNTSINGITTTNGNVKSGSRGDSVDSLDSPPNFSTETETGLGTIPAHLLEEARRLRENKSRLETRKTELEQCNQLLENQLTEFKAYISNSGALDAKTKKRLAKNIVEMEQMLTDSNTSTNTSSPSSPKTATTINNNDNNNNNRLISKPDNNIIRSAIEITTSNTSNQYHSNLLAAAADRVNVAVDGLVEAFTVSEEPESTDSGSPQIQHQQSTNGH